MGVSGTFEGRVVQFDSWSLTGRCLFVCYLFGLPGYMSEHNIEAKYSWV